MPVLPRPKDGIGNFINRFLSKNKECSSKTGWVRVSLVLSCPNYIKIMYLFYILIYKKK